MRPFADLQQLLHCGKSFRVYINAILSAQLGGAVKNVIAIGAGTTVSASRERPHGANHAWTDRNKMRLGVALEADPATFMGDGGFRRSGADLYRQPVAQTVVLA